MRSKPVAALLVDLDIATSHSRPHVSDDNPYPESQFKTRKYRPDFPACFGCIEDARALCQTFFPWYNTVYRHSGTGYMTPHSVHHGHAPRPCSLPARPPWRPRFLHIPIGVRTASRNPTPCPPRHGLTRHHTRNTPPTIPNPAP